MTLPSSKRTMLVVQGEQQTVTLCQCLRCGNIRKPRKVVPARCPSCLSPLWNKERKYQLKGKEAPTQPIVGQRGKPFTEGYDARRTSQRDTLAAQNGKTTEKEKGPVAPTHHKSRYRPEGRFSFNFAGSLSLVRHATRNLEDVTRTGSAAQLMAALEGWDKAIEEVQKARKVCEELLGEGVEAWIKD